MSEQEEVLEALARGDVLRLFSWAGACAFERVVQDYDEDTGHDQAVVGMLGYKYLLDRFDRAAGLRKFSLPLGASPGAGLDLLRAGISEESYAKMPQFKPGAITRADFNGSPAWAYGNLRWLLQSYTYGGIDKIAWEDKSETKRRVAHLPFEEDPEALFTFAEVGIEEEDLGFEGKSLVLAHAFDRATGAFELYLGRSRASHSAGESPWYWRHLVATGGPGSATLGTIDSVPGLPGEPASVDVADEPVRLRPIQDPSSTKQN